MIRVLLVDDQELVRAGLRGILLARLGFDIVGECADGSGVVAAVDSLAPDGGLMGVRVPGVDGVQATRGLRPRGGSPPGLGPPPVRRAQGRAGRSPAPARAG